MEPTKGSSKGSELRHNRAMRLMRYRAVCRAMPAHKNTLQQLGRKKLAWGWVQLTNRRQYSRIVWPWQTRPQDPKRPPHISRGKWRRIGINIITDAPNSPRVKRGRLSNPTAIR
jgi:hypothetical protein